MVIFLNFEHLVYIVACQNIYIRTDIMNTLRPIDAVNILPLARFEPTTWTIPPSTTPDIDPTN